MTARPRAAPRPDVRLEDVLLESDDEAHRRGEPRTTLHLLHFLLVLREVAAAVAAGGTSSDVVMTACNRALAAGPAEADAGRASEAIARAVAMVAGSERDRVGPLDSLIVLAEDAGCDAGVLLAAHGLAPLGLKLFAAHGSAPAGRLDRLRAWWGRARPDASPRSAPPAADELVAITMHDDPFTPMALVVDVLEKSFGLERADAEVVMRRIHETGEAAIVTLPHAEATRRIDEVTALARDQGAPLRLSLRPGDPTIPRAWVATAPRRTSTP